MSTAALSLKLSSSQTQRAKLLLIFCFLSVSTALDTVHNYVGRLGEGMPIGVGLALWWGLQFWLPYFLLVPAAVYLADRYPLELNLGRSLLIHGLAGLAFVYLHVAMVAIWPLYSNPTLAYGGRFFDHLQFDFALDYSLYCCIVAAAYLFQRYTAYKEREVRTSQLEASLAQSQLRTLQAQLNPHFFFNTLQAIAALALAGDRDCVVEMLGRLSDLIRVSFDVQRPQLIALCAEIEFLQGYLAIHQLSFGQRLAVRWDVAADTLDAEVPAMVLQPLVENAIFHGVAKKPGTVVIRIATRREGESLLLEVADSGDGFSSGFPQRTGVGLSATASRLELLYGDAQHIVYGRSTEGGADVQVSIPLVLRGEKAA